jgi:D-hydroxyproline dehydrogenase subunit alpha
MNNLIEYRCQTVVAGGGPAGIAAAVTSARAGASVVLVDDNPALGGQVWRASRNSHPYSEAEVWLDQLRNSSVIILLKARAFYAEGQRLFAETDSGVCQIIYDKLIVATGARERFLPFPGWTLPNVIGVGALQAFIKAGMPVAGKKIVVAGTGPLLFAAAAESLKHGAQIVCIAEQSAWSQFYRFVPALLREWTKLKDAARLSWRLRGVRQWKNCWPLAALGQRRLEALRLMRSGRTEEVSCDYLACGFHLVPNIELAALLGCRLENGFVAVDFNQQTSIPSVYCAGEPTGIGGVERALLEGQIAGCAATNQDSLLHTLTREHARRQDFVKALQRATTLRSELQSIATADTLVCRCEDVTLAQLSKYDSGSAAKLLSRCGMGPCQGRVCGPAADFLFGWKLNNLRPPLFPVRCSSLAAICSQSTTST